MPLEKFCHFFCRLHIEFVGLKAYSIRLVKRLSGLDTQKDLLHFGVLLIDVMTVIGGSKRYACFGGKPVKQRKIFQFLNYAVILDLNKVIILSEYFLISQCDRLCLFVVTVSKQTGYLSGKAGRKTYQSTVILFKKFNIHSRSVIKAFQTCNRHQLYKIAVSLIVLTQKDKMIRGSVQLCVTVMTCTPCNVYLAADNRLYPFSLCCVPEIHGSVHISVIGYCRGSLSEFLHTGNKLLYTASAVEQTVFRMDMKINKFVSSHLLPPTFRSSSAILASFWKR